MGGIAWAGIPQPGCADVFRRRTATRYLALCAESSCVSGFWNFGAVGSCGGAKSGQARFCGDRSLCDRTASSAGPSAHVEWTHRRRAHERGREISRSYAYGDSAGDVEMLKAVGHGIAVNPTPHLARVARKRGWKTCVWEKT